MILVFSGVKNVHDSLYLTRRVGFSRVVRLATDVFPTVALQPYLAFFCFFVFLGECASQVEAVLTGIKTQSQQRFFFPPTIS